MPTLPSFFTPWPVFAALMAVFYLVHLRAKNAAIGDVGWALGLPVAARWHTWRPGTGPAAWLLAGMTVVSGLHLARCLFLQALHETTSVFIPRWPRKVSS